MIPGRSDFQGHEKFKELSALFLAGNLTEAESAELKAHISICQECRAVYTDYRILTKEAMPILAARHAPAEEIADWDDTNARERFIERIAKEQRKSPAQKGETPQVANDYNA